VLEAPFRQIFVFNEVASLRVANARVVMLLVGDFDASFRRIFGGFLNVEGFCEVFIPSLRAFVLFTKRKKSLLSVWVPSSRFSGESPLSFSSFFFFRLSSWFYSGQPGFVESVVQVLLCRGL
jgi:hypothetical protein